MSRTDRRTDPNYRKTSFEKNIYSNREAVYSNN